MEVLHDNQDLQPVDFKAAFGVHCSPAVKTELTPSPNFGGGVGGFQATRVDEEDGVDKNENRETWLAQGDDDDVTNADPSSLFYGSDDFPSLPEFPCMSSSSSTSSTPAPNAGLSTSGATSSSSSSSSPSSSWAILKSDAEVEDDYQNLHQKSKNQLQQQRDQRCDDDGVDDCMNVMEDFDCMEINQLIEDSNEIWDPTPLFEEDQSQIPQTQTNLDPFTYPFDQEFCQSDLQQQQHQGGDGDDQPFLFLDPDNMEKNQSSSSCSALSEDLAVVFFEWLKSNKESISAEELRSIKIKKSTIESAAKRLGGGKEGMKQLLKLILQWVQNHRLQSKRSRSQSAFDFTEPILPNPENPNPGLIINPVGHHEQLPPQCFNQQQQQCWMPPPYIAADPAPSSFTSMVSYIGGHDPYGTVHQPYHAPDPYHHQHHMINDGSAWGGQMAAPPQFPLAPPPPQPGPMHYNTGPGPDGSMMGYPGYPSNGYNPYQFFSGDVVRMGSTTTTSATKEARKKRMARQRRMFSHHHHRAAHNNHNHHQHQQQQQMMMIQGGGDPNCLDPNAAGARPVMMGDHDSGGWVYWPPTTPGGGAMLPGQHMMQQPVVPERNGIAMTQAAGSQRQVAASASDKKQGFRTEKNLKFLLQKVLKQSDVGNLGRIVLPKKEAETHLPELEARDGIPIAMEDIGTSRVWNMRYRFWPNNKSRMYLLENTGDFVRSNGLQEGDFIVIYSDVKCGKYMIRGVKVRPQQQQGGSKAELAKKISKAQKTHNSASPATAAAALSPFAHRQ